MACDILWGGHATGVRGESRGHRVVSRMASGPVLIFDVVAIREADEGPFCFRVLESISRDVHLVPLSPVSSAGPHRQCREASSSLSSKEFKSPIS